MKTQLDQRAWDLEHPDDRLGLGPVPNWAHMVIILDTKRVGLSQLKYGRTQAMGNYWEYLLPPYNGRLYKGWEEIDTSENNTRFHIVRPDIEYLGEDYWRRFFNWAGGLQRDIYGSGELGTQPMTIVVDEMAHIFSSSTSRRVYMQGFSGTLSSGRNSQQTVWLGSQIPVFLDAQVWGNVSVIFLFSLGSASHRILAATNLGAEFAAAPIRDKHGFLFQNKDIEETVERPWYFDGKADQNARW